jgi:hypothetical protein
MGGALEAGPEAKPRPLTAGPPPDGRGDSIRIVNAREHNLKR